MVRTTKTEKQSAPAPVANVVVEQSATAKKASKKAAKEAEPVAVAPVVDAAAPVVESTEVPDNSCSVKMTEFGAKLQQLTTMISTLKSEYKTLEKVTARELKNAQKSSSRKRKSGNRQPSGFVKPTRISDELAQFLGKTVGTEMARTVVSKEINAYIHAHNLQDAKNGRIIHADQKLTELLKLKAGDELTYFNLQKYMKHHFVKASDVATA
jgi:chromatin remodeling complex protein RSC6